jgi:hypothetical protein
VEHGETLSGRIAHSSQANRVQVGSLRFVIASLSQVYLTLAHMRLRATGTALGGTGIGAQSLAVSLFGRGLVAMLHGGNQPSIGWVKAQYKEGREKHQDRQPRSVCHHPPSTLVTALSIANQRHSRESKAFARE